MGGLGVLILFAGYCWITRVMIRAAFRNGDRGLGWAVLVVAILLPLVDAQLGRLVLRHKCETEGKISITESVRNVDGFATYSTSPDAPAYYGYRFIETAPVRSSGTVNVLVERAEIGENGKNAEVFKKVISKARYRLDTGPRNASLFFYQTRISVREIATDRELSGFNWFDFRGGWAERVLSALSDAQPSSVANCGNHEVRRQKTLELLHGTLIRSPTPLAHEVQPANSVSP